MSVWKYSRTSRKWPPECQLWEVVAYQSSRHSESIFWVIRIWWPNPLRSACRKPVMVTFSGLFKEKKSFGSHKLFKTAFGTKKETWEKLSSFVTQSGVVQIFPVKEHKQKCHGKATSGNNSTFATYEETIFSYHAWEINQLSVKWSPTGGWKQLEIETRISKRGRSWEVVAYER